MYVYIRERRKNLMSDKRCERIAFARNFDATEKEVDEMWSDIHRFIRILMSEGYIAVIRQDEKNIIVIEYEHDERFDPWGCANPEWMFWDEHIAKVEIEGVEDN